jgi:hypothetical protein
VCISPFRVTFVSENYVDRVICNSKAWHRCRRSGSAASKRMRKRKEERRNRRGRGGEREGKGEGGEV